MTSWGADLSGLDQTTCSHRSPQKLHLYLLSQLKCKRVFLQRAAKWDLRVGRTEARAPRCVCVCVCVRTPTHSHINTPSHQLGPHMNSSPAQSDHAGKIARCTKARDGALGGMVVGENWKKWALFFTGNVINFPLDFLTQNLFPSKLNSVSSIAQIFPFSFYPQVCGPLNRNCIKILKNSSGNILSCKSSMS